MEIAFNAIKMNTQRLQTTQRRMHPASVVLEIKQVTDKTPAQQLSQFETKFRINKAAILVLKQMVFNQLVFSQGARTEILHGKISEKHLFYVEPLLEATILLEVVTPEDPVEITQNIFSVNPLDLTIVSNAVPQRFLGWDFMNLDKEMEPERVKKLQNFLDCFEKQENKGNDQLITFLLKLYNIYF